MTTGSLTLSVKAIDDESPHGDFEAILSTSQVDRDGETVKAGALNPLPGNIPIYYNHDWRAGALPVAKATPFYDGEQLKVKGTFASTARGQEMRSLVAEGIVESMSVGFIKSQARGKVVSKGTLIEGSFTGIPVNTGAKILAAKALEDLDPMPGFDPTVKTMDGSYEDLSEDLREALKESIPGVAWLCIRGTFADHVVYDVCDADDCTTTTYQVDYAPTGDDTFSFGEPVEVDVEEVVVATEEAKSLSSAKPAADDPAAASAAAGSSADGDAVNTLLARSLEHLAAI